MKLDKESFLLYALTDRTWLGNNSLSAQVEEAIAGGATFIQIREKSLPMDQFMTEALLVKKITDQYGIPFVVNDDIEAALKINADGVHVGQNDMEVSQARKLIGNDKILGVSAQTVEQALSAEHNGADYIGVGAVFPTSSKQDADSVSLDTLKQIAAAVSIPIVAIGGISEDNILKLKGSGIRGVAVISAIFANPDIKAAASRLLKLVKEVVNK